jgi:hypothetical protein
MGPDLERIGQLMPGQVVQSRPWYHVLNKQQQAVKCCERSLPPYFFYECAANSSPSLDPDRFDDSIGHCSMWLTILLAAVLCACTHSLPLMLVCRAVLSLMLAKLNEHFHPPALSSIDKCGKATSITLRAAPAWL